MRAQKGRSRIQSAEPHEIEQGNQHQANRKSEVALDRIRVEVPDAPAFMGRETNELVRAEELGKLFG